MTAKEISGITMTKDGVRQLLALPKPADFPFEDFSAASLRLLCGNCIKLWEELVVECVPLPISMGEIGAPGSIHTVDGEELRDALFSKIALYFDRGFRVYMRLCEPSAYRAIPGLSSDVTDRFARLASPDSESLDSLSRLFLSYNYLSCAHFASVLGFARPMGYHQALATYFELNLHWMLSMFYGSVRGKPRHLTDTLRGLIDELFAGILETCASVYARTPVWNSKHKVGAFSSIRLDELELLSRRDSRVVGRYGESKVARVFENQLSLVAQSFGLYVVSTRSGRQTVDLVCISGHPEASFTFLLEAKTTRNRYSLPTRDSRALRDYIQDVRATLTTMPSLAFVLLVGPPPAATVPSKLEALQSVAELQVRYCPAHVFAQLREKVPGPLPMDAFRREVLAGPMILGDGFVQTVVNAYEIQQAAHRSFVDSMLSLRHGRGIAPSGGTDDGEEARSQ